eukprot:767551-Hanusia_phi.AAC.2
MSCPRPYVILTMRWDLNILSVIFGHNPLTQPDDDGHELDDAVVPVPLHALEVLHEALVEAEVLQVHVPDVLADLLQVLHPRHELAVLEHHDVALAQVHAQGPAVEAAVRGLGPVVVEAFHVVPQPQDREGAGREGAAHAVGTEGGPIGVIDVVVDLGPLEQPHAFARVHGAEDAVLLHGGVAGVVVDRDVVGIQPGYVAVDRLRRGLRYLHGLQRVLVDVDLGGDFQAKLVGHQLDDLQPRPLRRLPKPVDLLGLADVLDGRLLGSIQHEVVELVRSVGQAPVHDDEQLVLQDVVDEVPVEGVVEPDARRGLRIPLHAVDVPVIVFPVDVAPGLIQHDVGHGHAGKPGVPGHALHLQPLQDLGHLLPAAHGVREQLYNLGVHPDVVPDEVFVGEAFVSLLGVEEAILLLLLLDIGQYRVRPHALRHGHAKEHVPAYREDAAIVRRVGDEPEALQLPVLVDPVRGHDQQAGVLALLQHHDTGLFLVVAQRIKLEAPVDPAQDGRQPPVVLRLPQALLLHLIL